MSRWVKSGVLQHFERPVPAVLMRTSRAWKPSKGGYLKATTMGMRRRWNRVAETWRPSLVFLLAGSRGAGCCRSLLGSRRAWWTMAEQVEALQGEAGQGSHPYHREKRWSKSSLSGLWCPSRRIGFQPLPIGGVQQLRCRLSTFLQKMRYRSRKIHPDAFFSSLPPSRFQFSRHYRSRW